MRGKCRALLLGLLLSACAVRPAAAQQGITQIGVLLAPGWNNLAYVGPTQRVPIALQSIAGKYEAVWTWDPAAQRWLGHNPMMPYAADFVELRQNQAYWLRTNAAAEILMTVPAGQPALTLSGGWNNFVYPTGERPVADALAAATGRYGAVWRWDPSRQVWNGYSAQAPAISEFSTLGGRRSYFVYLSPGAAVTVASQVVAAAPLPPLGVAIAAATTTPIAPLTPIAATPPPGVPVAVSPTPAAAAAGPGGRTGNGCYAFQSYQPQMTEVTRAQNRAAYGQVTTDPDFKVRDLDTDPNGKGNAVSGYVPPTLLKAIGWVESGWRQASYNTTRGASGPTIVSTSCAYGLMQLLTGMDIEGTPSAKQLKVGNDYLMNIAAAVQLLAIKWNFAPEYIPAVLPRNPKVLENWYYAVWAYHCFGEVCQSLEIHNNPDDPALKWPRPLYNSPEQLASGSQFTFTDYPYQELVYGVVINPPKVNNTPLWAPLPAALPPRGAVGFPEARPFQSPAMTLDPTTADQ